MRHFNIDYWFAAVPGLEPGMHGPLSDSVPNDDTAERVAATRRSAEAKRHQLEQLISHTDRRLEHGTELK